MSISASDIPQESRSEILKIIRNKIGLSEYQRIVDSIGEDKLLEAYFASFLAHRQGDIPPLVKEQKKTGWKRIKDWIESGLIFVFFLSFIGVFGNVFMLIAGVVFVVVSFIELDEDHKTLFIAGSIVGAIIGLIVGAIVGANVPSVGGMGNGILYGVLIGAGLPAIILWIKGSFFN